MSKLITNGLRHLGASVDNLTLDNAGRVLMPYQPSFCGSRFNANGSVNSSYTNFTWQSILDNTGNHWNNSTGAFTCPVAGRYLATFNFNKRSTNANWSGAAILKNGASQANSWFPGTAVTLSTDFNYAPVTINIIISCAAGDTISFAYQNGYASPSADSDGNFCSIQLIG